MSTELTNEQRDQLNAQARTILLGSPHEPALYRLLLPSEARDALERDQAIREKLWPDDAHERNRVVCRIKR